jgi:hypothetical protein
VRKSSLKAGLLAGVAQVLSSPSPVPCSRANAQLTQIMIIVRQQVGAP